MDSQRFHTQHSQRGAMVIVTGAGRSGTSTVAGVLKKLGLYVPQPEIEADASNPRGFFEPQWVVEFHKRLLDDIGLRTLDARPDAAALGLYAASAENKRELREWLASQLQSRQIVVKDPRAFWLKDLWTEVAGELDVTPAFLTMLRHPTEVVASRALHYQSQNSAEERLARETTNLAGWVNVALVNEQGTREQRRSFVPYPNLISDWRSTMRTVADHVGIDYEHDLASDARHEIDDFIDVDLRRARVTWDDIDVPHALREVAEGVWQQLCVLADKPNDSNAMSALDDLRAVYGTLHAHSVALVHHYTQSEIKATRRLMRRRMEAQTARQVERARQQVRQRLNAQHEQELAERTRASLLRRVLSRARSLPARRSA